MTNIVLANRFRRAATNIDCSNQFNILKIVQNK